MKRKPQKRRRVRKAYGGRETLGVSTQSLSAQAAAAAAGTYPTTYVSAQPALGMRPDPGPLPIVDAPTDGSHRFDRIEPLRFQFDYGWNAFWTPRRNALTPFDILRAFADTSDVSRMCIETRKDQMCSLEWDIAPRDKAVKKGALSKAIESVRTFFLKPDKKRPFDTWLRMALEEVLVVDALSIYRRRTYGGDLYSLEIKDGATMLPLLDPLTGDTPDPPNAAYRQIIYGRPVAGGDCSTDDLYYRPRTVRAFTPYGLSPIEAVILSLNAMLNRQIFNLSYYTDGNVPEGLLEAPKGFSTQQMIDLQQYLDDYLTGDLSRRRRLKVVHEGGSKVYQFKEPDFSGKFDEFLVKLICAAFAVPPSEVGFTSDVNRATANAQENIVYRRGVKPMAGFLKDLFDEVIAFDLKHPELQFVWSGGEVEDDLKAAQAMDIRIKRGVTSADEERLARGDEPIGLGPTIDTPTGPLPVEQFLKESKEALEAPKPEPGAPPPAKPGAKPGAEPPPAKPGQPPKPAGATPPLAGAPTEPQKEAVTKRAAAIVADLRKWRTVALKDAKANRAARAFTSDVIPVELHQLVARFLSVAGTDLAKIVAAFEMADAQYAHVVKSGESRTLTAIERQTAKAYQKIMAAHFKAEGAALLTHLRKGLA